MGIRDLVEATYLDDELNSMGRRISKIQHLVGQDLTDEQNDISDTLFDIAKKTGHVPVMEI